jgi:pyruvate dehydrogenase E1 component alpha subunit
LEEGSYHESINIAALEKLPVIYLCENNSLEALGQKAGEYPSSTLATADLCDLVKPFGVPTLQIDGGDPSAVHDAMSEAIARARSGGGSTFIEARTVRWPGNRPIWPELLTGETDLNYAWDDNAIPDDEHSVWHRSQDGLLNFVRDMLDAGHIDTDTLLELDRSKIAEMEEGIQFALDSPYPPPENALNHVLA